MNLYELKEEYVHIQTALEAKAEANAGEVSENLLERLSEISDNIDDKIEACVKVLQNLKSEHAAVAAEAARLDARANAIENNIERLKSAVVCAMEAAHKQKIKTPLFTIWTRENVSVKYDDKTVIPRDLCAAEVVTNYKPDTKAIKEIILSGGEVPGARIEISKSLQMR